MRPQRSTRLFTAALILAAALALTPASVQGAPTLPDVNVFAAASLTEAFTTLVKLFEERNPQVRVKLTFGGSQLLATQIEQGAPADVFASADQRWMTHVQQRGLLVGPPLAGPPREFVRNRLVVIVPLANRAGLEKLEDLARPGVKFVVAADAVPAGHYLREVLAKLDRARGFPRGYAASVLRNVVSEENDVKAVVAKVVLGEADAGAVYRSDVTSVVSGQVRIVPIPDQYNVVVSYPIAVVKNGSSLSSAAQFVAFVFSSLGQQILLGYNFIPVSPP